MRSNLFARAKPKPNHHIQTNATTAAHLFDRGKETHRNNKSTSMKKQNNHFQFFSFEIDWMSSHFTWNWSYRIKYVRKSFISFYKCWRMNEKWRKKKQKKTISETLSSATLLYIVNQMPKQKRKVSCFFAWDNRKRTNSHK